MNRPYRIGILGAGALGTLFAHRLASHTSTEVWLFARSPRPAGVTVEGEGARTVRLATQAFPKVDLLLVLVKAYATPDALRWAAGAIGPDTLLLTLQNGIGNAEILAEAAGADRVLVGTTAQGATLLGPGLVRHGGAGATAIAPWALEGPAADAAGHVAELLTSSGIPAAAAADPQGLLWSKLAVNCAINPLTAILQVPNGALLQLPDAKAMLVAAAREVGEVAEAAGIRLSGDPVERALAVAAATAANKSSMLQDILAGRRTEIDAISGAVAARAVALGVAAPVNGVLAGLVRSLEAK